MSTKVPSSCTIASRALLKAPYGSATSLPASGLIKSAARRPVADVGEPRCETLVGGRRSRLARSSHELLHRERPRPPRRVEGGHVPHLRSRHRQHEVGSVRGARRGRVGEARGWSGRVQRRRPLPQCWDRGCTHGGHSGGRDRPRPTVVAFDVTEATLEQVLSDRRSAHVGGAHDEQVPVHPLASPSNRWVQSLPTSSHRSPTSLPTVIGVPGYGTTCSSGMPKVPARCDASWSRPGAK